MTTNGKLLYFCYGSNLWSKRFNINIKSGVKYANGLLKDWKLTFNGYGQMWMGSSANIVPEANSIVWGTVWTISESDLKHLDEQEIGYIRIDIEVIIEGTEEVIKCKTYVQSEEKMTSRPDEFDNTIPYNIPSLAYKTVIINGAIEQQLPESYIQFLRSLPDNGNIDCGPKGLKL